MSDQRPNPPASVPEDLSPEALAFDGPLSRQLVFYIVHNVASARLKAGLTQQELAAAAELSRATVHLIEGGVGDPRLSTIARLAEALDLKLMDLLNAPQ